MNNKDHLAGQLTSFGGASQPKEPPRKRISQKVIRNLLTDNWEGSLSPPIKRYGWKRHSPHGLCWKWDPLGRCRWCRARRSRGTGGPSDTPWQESNVSQISPIFQNSNHTCLHPGGVSWSARLHILHQNISNHWLFSNWNPLSVFHLWILYLLSLSFGSFCTNEDFYQR